MTKRKYLFPVYEMKATGLPRDKWPLNIIIASAECIEKQTPTYEVAETETQKMDREDVIKKIDELISSPSGFVLPCPIEKKTPDWSNELAHMKGKMYTVNK